MAQGEAAFSERLKGRGEAGDAIMVRNGDDVDEAEEREASNDAR